MLTVVMYHYVRDFSRTRHPGIRGLDLAGFRRQLDHLQAHYTVVTVADVLAARRGERPLPATAALLTFDDAYAEHYALVFPELHARGLQGVFFAPVDPVCHGRLLDVNRVHFVLAAAPGRVDELVGLVEAAVEDARGDFDLEPLDTYRATWAHPSRFDDAWTIYIKRMLQTALPETLRNRIAGQLFARFVSADEATFAAELYMSEAQARLMRDCGMAFGAHGASHCWLNQVPRDRQEQEIDASLAFLKRIGAPVEDHWLIAYPYGGWNEGLLDVLRARGCSLGFTVEPALADLATRDPLLLPRLDTNDLPQ
ncbi:polysaccharide deacetylase family protein [Microvirga tunisiensis]|uniref:Chitooligosaccharide deacetylase n=1 Tax=Pannonibacter tanglangensis TaxID=2750084 RepID=A0A7X5J950_9HYPH|nr:polysaccharide deacetylase family protein [Pannonibacter sp. XCT-53]NBN79439.1 polysaccharide deacetylase family protein [Pannonibacter sp. XCT-53]